MILNFRFSFFRFFFFSLGLTASDPLSRIEPQHRTAMSGRESLVDVNAVNYVLLAETAARDDLSVSISRPKRGDDM